MKKRIVISVLVLLLISCKSNTENQWKELFNGKNLEGWVEKMQHHELGENYKNTYRVVDGKIQVNYDGYDKFDTRYSHLFYKESFSSFHLKFAYKFTDQWLEDAPSYTFRNSGVMFHSQAPETILKEQDWPISVEYQMLAEAEEGKPRPTGNMCSPGTEVIFEGQMDPRHCISSTSETYKWDEWIEADLIVYGNSLIIHKVNGQEVLRYTKPQVGGGVAKRFDPTQKPDGKLLSEGYIGLQSEGQGVEFKNIRIKKLD